MVVFGVDFGAGGDDLYELVGFWYEELLYWFFYVFD